MRAVLVALVLFAACAPKPPKEPTPKELADGLYVQGMSQYLQGKLPEALESYEKSEHLAPDDPRLPVAKGDVLLAQGKLKLALEAYRTAAAKDPRRAGTFAKLGFVLAQLDEKNEAKSALTKALALNPREGTALETLGELAIASGDVGEGAQLLSRAADAQAQAKDAVALTMRAAQALDGAGRSADAVALLRAAATKRPDSAELSSELGEHLVRAGDLAGAAEAFQHAAAHGDDPTLFEVWAELELRLGHPEQAEAALRASLAKKERALPHLGLARIRLAQKDREGAVKELDRALTLATGKEERETRELAGVLEQLGRGKDALALLRELADEPQNRRDVGLQLETAKLARGQNALEVVRASCQRVHEADGGVAHCP